MALPSMCLALCWQASTHSLQPMQRSRTKEISDSGKMDSGLWHQTHERGQPLRKTVVRMPGPSWIANFLTSKTKPRGPITDALQ